MTLNFFSLKDTENSLLEWSIFKNIFTHNFYKQITNHLLYQTNPIFLCNT